MKSIIPRIHLDQPTNDPLNNQFADMWRVMQMEQVLKSIVVDKPRNTMRLLEAPDSPIEVRPCSIIHLPQAE